MSAVYMRKFKAVFAKIAAFQFLYPARIVDHKPCSERAA